MAFATIIGDLSIYNYQHAIKYVDVTLYNLCGTYWVVMTAKTIYIITYTLHHNL